MDQSEFDENEFATPRKKHEIYTSRRNPGLLADDEWRSNEIKILKRQKSRVIPHNGLQLSLVVGETFA